MHKIEREEKISPQGSDSDGGLIGIGIVAQCSGSGDHKDSPFTSIHL